MFFSSESKKSHYALLFGSGKSRRVLMLWNKGRIPLKLSHEADVIIRYDSETMEPWVIKNRYGLHHCALSDVDRLDDDDDQEEEHEIDPNILKTWTWR